MYSRPYHSISAGVSESRTYLLPTRSKYVLSYVRDLFFLQVAAPTIIPMKFAEMHLAFASILQNILRLSATFSKRVAYSMFVFNNLRSGNGFEAYLS